MAPEHLQAPADTTTVIRAEPMRGETRGRGKEWDWPVVIRFVGDDAAQRPALTLNKEESYTLLFELDEAVHKLDEGLYERIHADCQHDRRIRDEA